MRYVIAGIWFVFTVSLSGWWVVFGLRQIDSLMALDHADKERLVRQQQMILWEGAALFLMLTAGAGALGYFMVRERREAEQVQRFLATFTHELRTPLASVRLQAEALREDIHAAELDRERPELGTLLNRLVSDTARLSLHLDNSLYLADVLSGRAEVHSKSEVALLAPQSMGANGVSLVDVVTSISSHWPAVAIRCESDAVLAIDRRAIESVVLNLVQNAISHGKAKEVHIHSRTAGEGRVEVSVENEGSPFSGDTALLGRLFQRFYSGSGSGVGLHLVETLVKRAGGTVRYEARSNGFAVRMLLPGMADGSAEK